ncbi:OTU domain-containing protein, partial [Catenuloplanes japonicus]|uniref:hypothetical protein n=1 Tax=Catenuloplanes japonicus TaxID=33876 RepID=UPI0005254B31
MAASVFEYFPIYASTSSTSIGTAQVYNFSAAPLQAFNIGDPIAPVQETVSDGSGKTRRADIPGGSVPLPTSSTSGGGYYTIRPEFGGAPGNQAINNVFYPPVSLQGGLKTGASATITATDRRGYRMPPDTAPKLAEVVSTVQATQSPTPGSRFAAAAKKALSQSRAEAPLSGRSEQLKRPYVLRELDVLFEVTGQTPRALSELTDTLTRFGDSLADQVSDGTVAKRLLSEPRRDNAGEAIAKAFENMKSAVERDPVTKKVYVAATVQVRIPLTELQPSRQAPPGRHLGSDRTSAADEIAVSRLPESHGWTALIGRGASTATEPLVGGRSTARIQNEMDAVRRGPDGAGLSRQGVVLVGDDHRAAGQRLSAAMGGYVLAQAEPMGRHDGLTDPTVDQKHQYQRAMSDTTAWALYRNGVLVRPLPGLNLADAMSQAMTLAGETPPAETLTRPDGSSAPTTPVTGSTPWFATGRPADTAVASGSRPAGRAVASSSRPTGPAVASSSRTAAGRRAQGAGRRGPGTTTAHNAPRGGNCLFYAVADSARSQGVTLRGLPATGNPHQIVQSLRTTGARHVEAHPEAHTPSLPSIGTLIAEDLGIGQAERLIGGGTSRPDGMTDEEVRGRLAVLIDNGHEGVTNRLRNAFVPQPMVALVQEALTDDGELPDPVHLLAQAMRRPDLWNSAIGDYIPAALARALDVNIVVQNPTYTADMLPNRPDAPQVFINRPGIDHFQSLRPSDSAGGVVGPDQSSWVSVGSPAPVA